MTKTIGETGIELAKMYASLRNDDSEIETAYRMGFMKALSVIKEIALPSEDEILEANREANANRFIGGAHWVKKFILNHIKP